MCSQYTVYSESPTASAVDSFTYTDTHPQASYHRIPTHRYISVKYYVTSAKICDSWHSHPLHRMWYRHTDTTFIVNTPVLERADVNNHQNSQDAHCKCQMTCCFYVSRMALLTTEEVGGGGLVIFDVFKIQQSVVPRRCFGCLMIPLEVSQRERWWLWKQLLSNPATVAPLSFSCWILVHHHLLCSSGWLYFYWLSIQNKSHEIDSLSSFPVAE